MRGCIEKIPTGEPTAAAKTFSECRSACNGKKTNQAIFTGDKCICTDWEKLQVKPCEIPHKFKVYWVTHFKKDVEYPIHLKLTYKSARNRSFILPDEFVVFNATAKSDELINYFFDYGDGTVEESANGEMGYSWKNPGTYKVKVTAETRLTKEIVEINVTITYVDEGRPPEIVQIYYGGMTQNKGEINLYISAVSQYPLSCKLLYGDGETKDFKFDKLINEIDEVYKYPEIGIYQAFFNCSNKYGYLSDIAKVYVVQNETELEDISVGTNQTINFKNPSKDEVNILLNNEKVFTSNSPDSIVFDGVNLDKAGDYLLQVTSITNIVLFTKILGVFRPVGDIDIDVDINAVVLGDAIYFTFKISDGDSLHISIQYGDGVGYTLFVPRNKEEKDPTNIQSSHLYKDYGVYNIEFEVANTISYKKTSRVVSVERIIEKASIKATHVSKLGEPTTFVLLVDVANSPSLPIDVDFYYGNGVSETVSFSNRTSPNERLIHKYVYPNYGRYLVNATIKNNVSRIYVDYQVQVGDVITEIDLLTSSPISASEVVIEVRVPKGSPVNIHMDMGDGTILHKRLDNLFHNPKQNRRKRSIENNQTEISTTAVPLSKTTSFESFITTAAPNVSEEKRNNSYEIDLEDKIEHINEPVLFKYKYSKSGTYEVSATVENEFGSKSTWLCPRITIIRQETETFSCSSSNFITYNVSSQQSPIQSYRSSPIYLGLSEDLSCQSVARATYTWRAMRLVKGEWKPELNLCVTKTKDKGLVLPKNIFWYGQIKLIVDMTVELKKLSRQKRELIPDSDNVTSSMTSPSVTSSATTLDETTLENDEKPLLPKPTVSVDNDDSSVEKVLKDKDGFYKWTDFDETYEATLVSSSIEVFLNIVPGPLVAKIAHGTYREVMKDSIVTMDVEGSHDPDVSLKNRSEIFMHLICFKKHSASKVATLKPGQLIAESAKLMNNTLDNMALYQYDSCFKENSKLWVQGFRV